MTKILITGADSMIGRELANFITVVDDSVELDLITHEECNLLNIEQVRTRFAISRPDFVYHLATYSGNIDFNRKYPADTFYKTTQMALNVLNIANTFKVKKVVNLLSSCCLTDKGDSVLNEEDMWNGLPNPTIECHGLAKRILHAYSRQLYRQHGFISICAIANNSFGPFDGFSVEKTKVIGGLIKKFVEAKEKQLDEVVCWGDGSPKRSFVYSKDLVKLLNVVMFLYNNPLEPINLPQSIEISIKELAEKIKACVGFEGNIVWDTNKPNGQMRKHLDCFKFNQLANDIVIKFTNFDSALQETVDWYLKNKDTWTK